MASKKRKKSKDPLGFSIMEDTGKLFERLVSDDDPEPLATYVECGGDLSGLSGEERSILARLIRRKSPRLPGQRRSDLLSRHGNEIIRIMIAYYKGFTGLPAYVKPTPTYSVSDDGDCCRRIAKDFGISFSTAVRAWDEGNGEAEYADVIEAGKKAAEDVVRDGENSF